MLLKASEMVCVLIREKVLLIYSWKVQNHIVISNNQYEYDNKIKDAYIVLH